MAASSGRDVRILSVAAAVVAALALPGPSAGRQAASVSGRITVVDQGDRPAGDVGEAVVWLVSDHRYAVTPDTVQVLMTDKAFQPNVTVVHVGSVVSYPNRDPFNHNVFSLAPEGPFDLGLYGRGDARHTTLNRPGVVRVYCNVHARMSSIVVVRDNPFHTQPAGDGSFAIEGVPPGRYELVAWHERAAEEARRPVEVTAAGVAGLAIELDARGYERVQHMNKYGRPYASRGRRY